MEVLNNTFDISIVIPTYNRSKLLDYTLQSLLLQDISINQFEVIIADDGSTDDTCEVINKYRDLMNLKYVFQEDNGYRPASARNKGIAIAEGNICLFIDSGIILNTDCLQKHIRFHKQGGQDVVAVGYVYGFDREPKAEKLLLEMIDPFNPASSIRKIALHKIYSDVREEHYIIHKDQLYDLPAPWLYFWTNHVSVSRANLLKVGMFDEQYDGNWGVEDNDLGFRLHQAGVKIYLIRSAESIHYPHHNNKEEKVVQGRFNCIYFNNKFATLETALFLQYYGDDEFVDINSISKQMALEASDN